MEFVAPVWSVVRISWPSWQCPSLLHPQTAALYLEPVHAFLFRRYPISDYDCVKALQLSVIRAGLVWMHSCTAPRSASSGVTVRSLFFPCMGEPDLQERCDAQSSALYSWARTTSETVSTRPALPQAFHTFVPTRLLEGESNLFTSASTEVRHATGT